MVDGFFDFSFLSLTVTIMASFEMDTVATSNYKYAN